MQDKKESHEGQRTFYLKKGEKRRYELLEKSIYQLPVDELINYEKL